MNHPIKYKAWHKELEKWIPTSDISLLSTREILMPTGSHAGDWYEASSVVELCFYTGLKDSTTKKLRLYEGDILLFPELGERVDIYYQNGAFQVLFSFEDEGTRLTRSLIMANNAQKVGHVLENPELLEKVAI